MRAWIARMTEDNIDQSAIEKAGEILKNGGLAAFPTETVYLSLIHISEPTRRS